MTKREDKEKIKDYGRSDLSQLFASVCVETKGHYFSILSRVRINIIFGLSRMGISSHLSLRYTD